ncbi:efflux RND transporter periplasmic adaptor subunit [Kordiimonas sp. SCSIO 12603]|uniref:efflux RND transporter periplasmic adaptor subunit n=1 Tax=Kordiimonas sp. SCSIO 12603 TaxID=2829596 RepID=UPI002103A6CE|nr:efflux RND transporter periplasmic adaptor subunit [Kordiimonas sp. SCSIO 12603]UTW59466.1 efflux RND transporter periplasmic adaptor subunit [Kordiimonas sp. SCSIO 12603]
MMRKILLTSTIALSVGLGLGFIGRDMFGDTEQSGPSNSKEKEILYWVAPMDKNFRSDNPGKSPMGMDLIPVYEGEEAGADDPNALKISAAVINNIGVRTEKIGLEDLAREVDTVGYITPNEDLSSHVHVRSAGWVEKLYRKAVGEWVQKDELIFELYSPELVNAQTEFVQAIKLKQSALKVAAKERLRALGMEEGQISQLEQTGKVKQLIEVRAPQDGVILALNIGEGMHVTPGKTVFSLSDLSSVWVKVDVFEGQSDWIKEGQDVQMILPFLPGENWQGAVDYVYPLVDPKSRTVQVRLAFENSAGRLKPNMYGEIRIEAEPLENVLTIPREALIRTGKNDRVIIAVEDNKFRPAEVLVGRESGDRLEIKAGLQSGETVVTSGQFLIDSEASINSSFLRLLDAGTESEDNLAHEMEMETHHGMGTVNSITGKHTVNLTHQPITSLGWPEMTMDFTVSNSVDLSQFSVGDMMHFELRKNSEGMFEITSASKM